MTPARRAICGIVAVLITGLPFGLMLAARQPCPPLQEIDAGERSIVASLLPPAAAPTRFAPAQPLPLNFAGLTDQTSRSPPVLPAAGGAASGHEASSDDAYLPVSQLTEWPRRQALPLPPAYDGHVRDPGRIVDALTFPATLEAVLMIDEQGDVERVQIHGDALEASERHSLERWLFALRFTPGRLYGRPVRSRLTVELVLQ